MTTVFAKILEFMKSHKRAAAYVLGVLLVFAAGYGAAIMSRPAKVVEKTVVKTQVQTVVQYQDRVVTQKVYVQVQARHRHTETVTTKRPDGTVVTQTKTDSDVNTNTNVAQHADAQHAQTVVQRVVQTVYKEKLVLQQPNWSVYAGAGYALPTALGHPQLGVPGMDGFVVQAGIDRRIAGPFWLGLWGNTQGTIGLNLRVTW